MHLISHLRPESGVYGGETLLHQVEREREENSATVSPVRASKKLIFTMPPSCYLKSRRLLAPSEISLFGRTFLLAYLGNSARSSQTLGISDTCSTCICCFYTIRLFSAKYVHALFASGVSEPNNGRMQITIFYL